MPNQNYLNVCKDLLDGVRNGSHTVEQFSKKIERQDLQGEVLTTMMEAKALESQTSIGNKWVEQFNYTRSKALGIQDKMEVFSSEEQKELAKQAETFSQSVSDTNGTVMSGIIATNLQPLMEKYFYDSPLLSRVDRLAQNSDAEKVTDITNDRTADADLELASKTATDDTTVVDTIQPDIRINDKKEISHLLNEVLNPRDAALNLARMERAVRNKIDSMIIGATGSDTDGAGEFYSILNSKASTGTLRGSLAVTVTGVNINGHVDAINYVVGELPLYDASEVSNIAVVADWETVNRIMRDADSNNQYYFDMQTRTSRHLLTGSELLIVDSMPADTVGVFDLFNYKLKLLRAPRMFSFIDADKITMVYDTYADGTPTFAYKATPTKNGFRHFTIETDNNYAS